MTPFNSGKQRTIFAKKKSKSFTFQRKKPAPLPPTFNHQLIKWFTDFNLKTI